jgi:hypothetical protein
MAENISLHFIFAFFLQKANFEPKGAKFKLIQVELIVWNK